MRYLRQSTATIVEVGPFVDDTDGKTLEEALTVASIDVQLMQPLDLATIPATLTTNGAFGSDANWTKGTNWTISGGNASHGTGTASDLEQNQAVTEFAAYEVIFTTSTTTAGTVFARLAGTAGANRTTDATFTETIIAGSGGAPELEFVATSDWDGDIDDVSCIQVPLPIVPAASGSTNDMVLARANTGTYWLEVTADQLGIAGRHKMSAFISGALIVWEEFTVLAQEVYDDLFASGAVGYLKPTTAGRDLNVSAGNAVVLVDTTTTNTDVRGTDNAALASVCTEGRLAELAAANLPSDVDAILADTNELQGDWVDAGRLDLIIDAILLDTGTDGVPIASGGIASTAFAAGAIDAAAIAADAIGSSELASSAVDEIVDQAWDEVRSGHATAGTFGESFQGVVSGAAEAGTLSTTQMTTDLAEATDDHYNGSTCIWLTGVLAGQRTNITDYAGANGLLTYTAVTEAPSATDRFILI